MHLLSVQETNRYGVLIDGHESKPALCISAIIKESQKLLKYLILTHFLFVIKHNVA